MAASPSLSLSHLPTQSRSIAQHLSDRGLTPILSSAGSPSQREALTTLTTTALTSYTTAGRLGFGAPVRILVEYANGGPVVLHSFLNPSGPGSADGSGAESTLGEPGVARPPVAEEAPMLVGVVVGATAGDGYDARRAAVRLERVGREFQKEWVAEERGESNEAD